MVHHLTDRHAETLCGYIVTFIWTFKWYVIFFQKTNKHTFGKIKSIQHKSYQYHCDKIIILSTADRPFLKRIRVAFLFSGS